MVSPALSAARDSEPGDRASLRWGASVRALRRQIVISLDQREMTITGLGAMSAAAHRFLATLTSGEPYLQVASRVGLHAELAEDIIRAGVDQDFIRRSSPAATPALDASAVAMLARAIYPTWKEAVFSHPLWRGLARGQLPRTVFVGWVLEHFHFIEGVTLRMPPAIAACQHRGVREILSRHFSQEYDHYKFFLRSLDRLGLSPALVQGSRPLPGTRAVINLLRSSGQHWLSYACCSGFLESTGRDRNTARAFLAAMAKHYDSRGLRTVKPIVDHVAMDESFGHGSLLEKICEAGPCITQHQMDRAFQTTYLLVETLRVWSTDILQHYATADSLRSVSSTIRRYRPLPR